MKTLRIIAPAMALGTVMSAAIIEIDPTITVKGENSGMAVAGTNDKGADTTATQLKQAQDYILKYNGPTEFTGDYTIFLKDDKTVDPTKCNGPVFLDKKKPFLRWWAALKMKESQCPERVRVTRPA